MLAKLTSSDRAQTEREVITCLFHLLNATEPQVPVTKGFDEELEELLVSLLEEDILSVDFGTWGLIFECIDKANLKRSTGTRYGRPLLDFVGYLWLALHDGGDAAIPRTAAIQLLIAVQRKDSRYARYCIDTAGQFESPDDPDDDDQQDGKAVSGIAQAKANPNQRKGCKSLQIDGSARDGPKADWHEGEEGDGQNKQPRGPAEEGLGCHAGRSTGCRERVKASFGLPDVHGG